MLIKSDEELLEEACRAYCLGVNVTWESLNEMTQMNIRSSLIPVVLSVKKSISEFSVQPVSRTAVVNMAKDKQIQGWVVNTGEHMKTALFPESWAIDLLLYIFDQYPRFVQDADPS